MPCENQLKIPDVAFSQFFYLCVDMQLLKPLHWKDYELIDSGNFEKLERFGEYTLIRPEPQAIWKKIFQMLNG